MGQILRIITTESIVPLAVVEPTMPPDVAELVGRMLQRDRALRPRSMAEVQAVLHRYAPEVQTRSIGDPAIQPPRLSRPSIDETSVPKLSLNTSGDRAVISKKRDVSPTAATLSSTTASTTADRAAILRTTRSRWPLYVATRSSPAASGASGGPASVAVPPAASSAPAPPAGSAPASPPPTASAVASSATTAATPSPARPVGPRTTSPALAAPVRSSTPAKTNAYDHM
jgi:hypothetical protein